MSNTKRFAIILLVEFLLIIIGLVKVSIIAANISAEPSNFTFEYMLGYSIPIVLMGMVVFFCCVFVLRERRIVSR